ncbi:MAG TPA: histone deacetylase family protein [Gammaproteobacteria bacterium]|nr:histone deacetylase family protein [Gammaproteobacteria bacterium]
MFLIRKIYDDATSANQVAIAQAQAILRAQFPGLSADDIAKLPDQLHDPLKHRFHAQLLAAENGQGELRGFALLLHAPDLRFAYLEYISAAPGGTGGGIGGALYERVREEAAALNVTGLFFECLPDDPALSPDPAVRAQNAARLKFYERYGARPLANTAYETPVKPGDDNPPYLVMDPLGSDQPLGRAAVRRIVRAILDRKYGELCPQDYVELVIASIKDDPVQLRAPRYIRGGAGKAAPAPVRERRIALIVNDKHDIHHVRERGYVESPVRIKVILQELEKPGFFERMPARKFPQSWIRAVHDRDFVQYLMHACARVPEGKSVYPYVFPIRNAARPPHDLPLRAGYYCIDTFTPLNRNASLAALGAVDCALTGAQCLVDGYRAAYALVRPPGHHAERGSFGGFCYFNSAAIAANYLSRYGKVVVLDVDYHHGNGTENIFYQRADVFTVSLHGHPRMTYPYFSGFEDERGEGEGLGYNLNIPLPEGLDGAAYRQHLARALKQVARFKPRHLVLGLGLDTAKGDPTGSFTLTTRDFHENGRMIGALGLPTLVTQEGGYRTRSLGQNARHFFQGLWEGMHPAQQVRGKEPRRGTGKRS